MPLPRRELVVLAAAVFSASLVCGCRGNAPVARLRTSPPALRLGYPESAPLYFDWSPSAPLDGDGARPTVFVHLLDTRGAVRRTFDHPFPREWSPGKPVSYDVELYQSALAPALPPGSYTVSAGLYDPSTGRRWALDAGGAELGKREYRMGTLEASPPDPAFASKSFAFEGEWGTTEPDPSVQVLARRRLRGPAALRFTGRPGVAGSVRLALTVRGVPLAVESECGPPPSAPLEPGYHWVGFDLPASGSCTIRFPAPVRSSGAPESLADAARAHEAAPTSLDVAAWRPASR